MTVNARGDNSFVEKGKLMIMGEACRWLDQYPWEEVGVCVPKGWLRQCMNSLGIAREGSQRCETDAVKCVVVTMVVCRSSLLSSFIEKNKQVKQPGEIGDQTCWSFEKRTRSRYERGQELILWSLSAEFEPWLSHSLAVWLCNFGQVILPLSISFSSSVN